MRPRFRIAPESGQASTGANGTETPETVSGPEMISVALGEILDPLSEALRTNRTFLSDFSADEIRISADLFDALTTFQRMRASA